MISEYDVRRYTEREDSPFYIDDNNNIVTKENGQILIPLEDFVQRIRREIHCDFELVYNNHPFSESVYRCNECGTVIFTNDDEDYDPTLCCPVCSEYKTHFKYWSGAEIASDVQKRSMIKMYEQLRREDEKAYKRYIKRGRKWDWQICKFSIKLLKRKLYFNLECDNLHKTKLKGLRLDIDIGRKDGLSYVIQRSLTIPLSLSHFKVLINARRMQREQNGKNIC